MMQGRIERVKHFLAVCVVAGLGCVLTDLKHGICAALVATSAHVNLRDLRLAGTFPPILEQLGAADVSTRKIPRLDIYHHVHVRVVGISPCVVCNLHLAHPITPDGITLTLCQPQP